MKKIKSRRNHKRDKKSLGKDHYYAPSSSGSDTSWKIGSYDLSDCWENVSEKPSSFKSSKMSKNYTPHSFQNSNLPIKIVENNIQNYKNLVVKGQGLVTTVVAMVQLKFSHSNKEKNIAKWKYKALHILLDSGSDVNLLFLKPESHTIIPTKERILPQK